MSPTNSPQKNTLGTPARGKHDKSPVLCLDCLAFRRMCIESGWYGWFEDKLWKKVKMGHVLTVQTNITNSLEIGCVNFAVQCIRPVCLRCVSSCYSIVFSNYPFIYKDLLYFKAQVNDLSSTVCCCSSNTGLKKSAVSLWQQRHRGNYYIRDGHDRECVCVCVQRELKGHLATSPVSRVHCLSWWAVTCCLLF